MRKTIGYSLITFSYASFIVWLLAAFFHAEHVVMYLAAAGGFLAAGCAVCADELFGELFPKRRRHK